MKAAHMDISELHEHGLIFRFFLL